ncbi:DUF418 domain-containing protein [Saccharopolyspora tripterygii]
MPVETQSAPAIGVPASPTPVSERALAPDLARGVMLLLIALAHAPWFAYTADIGVTLMHPGQGGVADRIAQAVTIIAVDARAWTMFGFLFAYGIGQLYARRTAGGSSTRDARRLLRTRHWWLLGFGLVHAALLWQGDILATYGLLGLLLVPLFLRRSDRVLKVWVGVLLGVGAVFSVGSATLAQLVPAAGGGSNLQQMTIAEPNYLVAIPMRLLTWSTGLVSGLATLVLPAAFLLGLLAARHRVLEGPARHLPLLRGTAFGGLAVGWSFGLVQALVHFGVIELPNPMAFGTVHLFTGIFCGIGYAALFGLLAHRIAGRGEPPLLARALVALGRRSLSGYLTQSLLFVPLLSAWGFGLGAHLTSWSAMAVGFAAWLLTLVVAHALDRRGIRGPAETLLRRLTYRPGRHRATAVE